MSLDFSTQFVNDPVTTRNRTTRSNIAPQHSRMKVPIHVKFPYWPINKKNICWKQLDHINSNAFQPYVIYGWRHLVLNDTWYWATRSCSVHSICTVHEALRSIDNCHSNCINSYFISNMSVGFIFDVFIFRFSEHRPD